MEPSVLDTPFTIPTMQAESPHGAIYLFRTAHQHHAQLALLADQKASILIGASSVIVTVILAKADMLAMPIPLLVLGTTCVFAGLLAIIGIVTAYHWKRRRMAEPNLIFFGFFAEITGRSTSGTCGGFCVSSGRREV